MTRGRLVRRLLAVTLSLLVLGGCGDNEGAPQAEEPASSATSADPTDDASEGAGDEQPGAAGGEEISAQDFVDIARESFDRATTAKVSMTMGGGGVRFSAEGEADYEKEPVAMAMTMSISQLGAFEIRLVDDVMFVKAAKRGEKFAAFGLDDPDSLVGPIVARMDGSAVLDQLEEGITKAVYAGQEDIDGEGLDHYTVTADAAAMFDYFPPKVLARLPETLDYEWYIDDDGLFRGFATELRAGRKTVEMELSFHDWGADVDIEAPPSDEVTTMAGTSS
jgi:hypothetical protein